ncbi:hypothetical protein PRIPAC_95461, partial [Pristionchus pacificus]
GSGTLTFIGALGIPDSEFRGIPENRLFGTDTTEVGRSIPRTVDLSKYPHLELPFSPKIIPRYRTSSLPPFSITQRISPRLSVNSSAVSPL